ncbi:MAG: hypothetical protein HYU66_15640 [Armatimonadetes bacterium]|nr:hypothetical protein [Armatimonadota bacterium]
MPPGSRGWINMFREQLWVLPFAKVRHHPAFKAYSQARYGDPEALDRKVRTKLLREIDLMFQSVFSQKLLTNYQEANYVEMWLLGVLLEDPVLRDFAGPNAELTLYNHTYQDGLNGEGAPNYMAMPGGYFYPFLRDPKGFGFYYPKFLEEHPFSAAAATEMRRLNTVRGVDLEFGDQHEMAFPPAFTTDPAAVRANELVGSRNWAGYGVGVLRVGGPGHRQEVGLSYTRCSLHNAQDALSIECWVDGVPVLRRGGYAANWHNAPLQWERPEYQALRKMDYPHPIEEGEAGFGGWSWVYAHSPLCQNGATVDDVATGRGWGDNRGYGEVICFKGGEPEGEPGSGFQVLDVRDHYSWSRVGKPVREFRRTLIGIEGPDGRPYVLDLLKLSGGNRHTLYTSAWAERAAATLPAPTAKADDLAARLFRDRPPEDTPDYRIYRHVRQVAAAPAPAAPWEVTWRTDVAAYAARDAAGKPFQRPIPDDVGRVRLRLVGIETAPGGTELISAKGPWIAWLRQPLPGGQRADGNVSFVDARDFVIERRTAAAGDEGLVSVYCHVLEGYREGEASMIRSVKPLAVTSLTGGERDVVALELAMAGGHTDTVIYQSDDGTIRLPDGLETDARYALVRRDAQGQVTAADAVRGTSLRAGSYRAGLAGDFTGTIVDVIGDLTGTRRESALVIRPDRPWPAGEDLRDRQLLVRVESGLRDPCNEGWRVAGVAALPDGLVRVDVQDHAPFATSWHQVIEMPADRPSVLRTHRPMVDHGNSPWYNGLSLWLPERGKLYTIKRTNEVGGGLGGDTVELDGAADPAADGVTVGDWYVIHAVRPGLRVAVANDFAWRTEPARDWRQHALRATGPVSLECPVTRSSLAWRAGDGAWQTAPNGQTSFAATAS